MDVKPPLSPPTGEEKEEIKENLKMRNFFD